MDLSKYLCQNEVTQLNQAFEVSLQHDSALVFWTGISPDLAKNWARSNDLKTLTMAMGSLYTDNGRKSGRSQKSTKTWSKYMKGASWVFAQQACHNRYALVLTNAPPNVYSTREHSNYREIEEPILKGLETERHAIRIDYVHPTVPGAACFRYQVWPDNRSSEWLSFLECVAVKDIVNKIVQCTNLRRSEEIKESEYTKQNELEKSIFVTAGINRKSDTAHERMPAEQINVNRVSQAANERKAAKRLKVERQQQAADERKAAKRLKVERQQQAANERKAAKRLKAERQQQAAKERKAAKRLKAKASGAIIRT